MAKSGPSLARDGRRQRLPFRLPWKQVAFTLALLMFATSVHAKTEIPCSKARLQSLGSPAREEWIAALGPDSTELRIQVADPRKWIIAHAPRWEPEGLLAQHRSWPPDTLRVTWDQMTRVETRVTNSPGTGMAIGGIIGGGIAIGIGAIGASSGGESAGWSWIGALLIGAFTVPTGIIVGGSIGQDPHWEPVYCAEHD